MRSGVKRMTGVRGTVLGQLLYLGTVIYCSVRFSGAEIGHSNLKMCLNTISFPSLDAQESDMDVQ